MFKVDPALFSSAENNIILGMKELDNLKRNMNECALSFPDSYEFTKDINEVFLKICNLHFDSEELLNKVTFAKKKLCELDKGFALTYYACALQNYAEVSGELTLAQEEYIKYSQSQYYDSLYTMLEDNKDNLTPEQAEIYKALKEQKEIEKKYDDLQKLYQEKEDNNGFWHPIIEKNINDKIKKLENELGLESQNKWYEDIGYAITKTGCEWGEGFSSLFAGEGFGELWDATKQTFATGAVVSRSVDSGFAKLGELIVVDGLSLVGGSLASGATWLFHDIWTDNDLADNVMDSTLDFVRRDLIGEANENFYENTSYGNWINENSNLKYDSAGAKAIQTGSEFFGKIALATAATIFSGGMAAPIALGALYGTGKATERYTQSVDRSNREEYSYGKALGKALAGAVGGSAEFYGYGRMGSAIYNGLKGLKNIGFKNIVSHSKSSSKLTFENLSNDLKNNFSKNFKSNFFEADTMWDTGAVLADHGVNWLTGDESSSDLLKYGGLELLLALGLNAFGAGLGAFSESAVNAKMLSDFDKVKAVDMGSEISSDIETGSRIRSTFNTKVVDSVEEINPTETGFKLSPDLDSSSRLRSTFNKKVVDSVEEINPIEAGFKLSPDLDGSSRLKSTFNSNSIKNIDEVKPKDITPELSDLAKNDIGINISAKSQVYQHMENLYGTKRVLQKEWAGEFIDYFEKHNISQVEIKKVQDILLSESNLENMYNNGSFTFMNEHALSSTGGRKAFFSYLNSIEAKMTPEYLQNAIDFSVSNAGENGNLVDSFIKYVVVTNFDDLSFKSTFSTLNNIGDSGKIICTLGDFELCKVDVELFDEDLVCFDFLETRPNLKNSSVGSALFQKLAKEVYDTFPDKKLAAFTLLRDNAGGIRFYEKNGGKFFELDNINKTLTSQEIDYTLPDRDIGVIFERSTLKQLSEKSIVPKIEDGLIIKKEIEPIQIIDNVGLEEIEMPKIINKLDTSKISNQDLVTKLKSVDTSSRDLKVINDYINERKIGNLSGNEGGTFLYKHEVNNVGNTYEYYKSSKEFTSAIAKALNIEEVTDLDAGVININGFTTKKIVPNEITGTKVEKINPTYRISLQNSHTLKDNDIVEFLSEFNKRATNDDLSYGIKIKPIESDVIIFYLHNDDLSKAVSILDAMSDINKSNEVIVELTSKFGEIKPFTSSLSENSYYGVSSYAYEILGKLRGSRNDISFTQYSGHVMDISYDNLLKKYNGDISKITPEEIYSEMHKFHRLREGFDESDNIPLWMSREIYNKNILKK